MLLREVIAYLRAVNARRLPASKHAFELSALTGPLSSPRRIETAVKRPSLSATRTAGTRCDRRFRSPHFHAVQEHFQAGIERGA